VRAAPVSEVSGPYPGPVQEEPAGRDWTRIRRRTGWGYLALLVLIVIFVGVPTDRFSLFLIILAGLGITCLGRGWRSFGRVILDWLPFTVVLIIYDESRGVAKAIGLPLHETDVAAVDKWAFGGTVPTVWLQDHFLTPGSPHWYDAVATLVYTSHFLATPIVAAVLWLRDRAAWIEFVRRVIALSVLGLITYTLYPAAPPWYAARDGVIDPVIRASSRGWLWLHINHAGNLLSEGQAAANPVAAMPSLHTAFATIIALYVGSRLPRPWRYAMVLYPVVMGLSLVYLGEHYVIDVVAGVVYALVTHFAIRRWEVWRAERRSATLST
jgi:membrane-associated phospholipid phosphatase